MKRYLTELLFLLLLICVCYIGCNWGKRNVDNSSTVDTVYIKGETIVLVDTVFSDTTIYKPVATLVYVGDSSRHVDCDSIREYTESLDDSSGLVVVESKVQGELIDQKITLQSYVTSTFRVDTLRITNTITKYKPIIAPFVEVQNSTYPLSVGVILGRNRTFIGAKVDQQGNFSGIFGYNLVK